jgi:hypothetical protein
VAFNTFTRQAVLTPKKATVAPPVEKVTTSNFFAPLRSAQMDTDAPPAQNTEEAAAPGPGKTNRPPPIVLTSAANLIQLQKQLKGVTKQPFEFRNTKNGTRVVTKDMVDYQAIKNYFDKTSLTYFTFYVTSTDRNVTAV